MKILAINGGSPLRNAKTNPWPAWPVWNEKEEKALESELGIGADASYEPLNNCSLYVPLTKPSRHKLSEQLWRELDPSRFQLPVCDRIYKEESVCFHHKVLMGSKADMEGVADAIKKVYDHADELL